MQLMEESPARLVLKHSRRARAVLDYFRSPKIFRVLGATTMFVEQLNHE